MYVGENTVSMGRGPQGRGCPFVKLPEAGYVVGQTEMKGQNVVTRIALDEEALQRSLSLPWDQVGVLGLSKDEKEKAARALGELYSTYINSFKDMKECQKLIAAAQAHIRKNPASGARLQPLLDKAFALREDFKKLWDDSFQDLQKAEQKGIGADFAQKTADMYLSKATLGVVKVKDSKSGLSLALSTATSGEFGTGHRIGAVVVPAIAWVAVTIVGTGLSVALVLWCIGNIVKWSTAYRDSKNKHEAISAVATGMSQITKLVAEYKITAAEGGTLLDKLKENLEPAVEPSAPSESGKFLKTMGTISIVAGIGALGWYGYRHGWFDKWIGNTPGLNMIPRRA